VRDVARRKDQISRPGLNALAADLEFVVPALHEEEPVFTRVHVQRRPRANRRLGLQQRKLGIGVFGSQDVADAIAKHSEALALIRQHNFATRIELCCGAGGSWV
jgi:hypothetical protein